MAKKVKKKIISPKSPSGSKKARKVSAEIVENDSSPAAPLALLNEIDDDSLVSEVKKNLPVAAPKGLTSTDPLVIYLNEIRRYPVLSREDEVKLAQKYHETKDPEIGQTLVKSNLRFVVKVAAEYSRFGARMIDLIQEGNVGLMHAVKEFNPYKGNRLITYAVWWIRGYIQEYLMRQYSMVRIGTTQNQRKLFYQLQKQKDALDAMGEHPNLALLSERLGIPEDEINDMAQRLSGRDVSLDRPIDGNSSTTLQDLQKDPKNDENLDDRLAREEQLQILKEKIEEIRPELSDREKIILDERILNDEPLTLQEIGEKYGITREAVRQMEARLMKKIKTRMV
jgi:RNA polymerase sigma-32 factor